MKNHLSKFTLACLLFLFSEFSLAAPPPGLDTVGVKVAKVAQQDMPQHIQVFGEVYARNAATLSSEIGAQVQALSYQEGQWVTKGTLLIQLNAKSEEATLAKAQSEEKLSELDYQRTMSLSKQKAIAQHDLDTVKTTLDGRKADVASAEAALAKTQIKAPFDGRVGSRQVSVGDYVSPGKPLVEIVDNHYLKLHYSVPQRYLDQLALGQHDQFVTSAFGHKTFNATVDYIAPMVDKTMRTVEVESLVQDAEHTLSPGLSGYIVHEFSVQKNMLVIPEQAVMTAIDGQSVFRVVTLDNQLQVEKVLVTVGSDADGKITVLNGLSLGDQIVIEGQQKLRDGLHVHIEQ